jgi:hypothetical protein
MTLPSFGFSRFRGKKKSSAAAEEEEEQAGLYKLNPVDP